MRIAFVAISLFIFAVGNVYANTILTKDLLISSNWVSNPDEDCGSLIEFTKDNRFTIYCVGECGDGSIKGIYRIANTKLELIVTEKTGAQQDSKISREILILADDRSNPICTVKIISETNSNLYYFRYKSKVEKGMIRIIDNDKVVIINTRDIKVKSKSRIRKGPGLSYQPYTLVYKNKDWEVCYENKSMKVIGRSEHKETINNFEDYWYYVKIYWDMYSEESGPVYGWIHGSVIK
jgi:hypothetical protein